MPVSYTHLSKTEMSKLPISAAKKLIKPIRVRSALLYQVPLLKYWGKKGTDKKSGIEKAIEDVKTGRVHKAKDADELFKQILG